MTENYLKLLSKGYKNIDEICTEIINLEAILSLPKGTEHFITDIHGEYEAFDYIRRSASGVLKNKIEDIFGTKLKKKDREELATLIFYPKEILEDEFDEDWYRVTLLNLIKVSRVVASKYTRSKVRKAIPKEFAYIIEELLSTKCNELNKEDYYGRIIDTVIELKREDIFIITLCELIQRLSVDKLHIVGDLFDRGDETHKIIDDLIKHHNVDIQWGNHDILWMGAGMGQEALIANVLRISFRYSNFSALEDAYGINLLPLALFSLDTYADDEVPEFIPKKESKDKDKKLIAKMHKAISIIQFKLEGIIKKRNPQLDLKNMGILEKIDFDKGVYVKDGKEYPLTSNSFPTVDKNKPFELSNGEKEIMEGLKNSFLNSDKLQEHIRFLLEVGSMYKIYNGNLLFHGCIPFDDNGEFANFNLQGQNYSGKGLMDYFDELIRRSYREKNPEDLDMLWYLWTGRYSPLFGKEHMATFERYFLTDKSLREERKNPYYHLREEEKYCMKILKEFGLEEGVIINGHTPVLGTKGESPIKANGKMLCIDGGFSKGYQDKTGVAGYTLIYNSYGLRLASHKPFISKKDAIKNSLDIIKSIRVVEKLPRKFVRDTDIGREIMEEIRELKELMEYYSNR